MIQKIYKQLLNREVISYLVFGVLTTLVNLVVFSLCNQPGVEYWIANAAAWIVSVLFAFVTNKLFVFESKTWKLPILAKELTSFVACRLLSGLFDMGLLIVTVELFHLDAFLGKLIGSVVVVIMNYVFSKLFIFKNKTL